MRLAVLTVLALAPLLAAQPPQAQEAALRAHLAFLADDLLEGRGTGQRGGALAVRYLEAQLQALGLEPANGTSYRQTVRLAGLRVDPDQTALTFTGTRSLTLALGTELVVGAGSARATLPVSAPLVFVGHGIFAQDGSRDDYKGFEAKGKILVMLVGDRPGETPGPPCCQAESYYGRWTYKFEEAQRRGAAGVLLIHTPDSAGYGWAVVQNGWRGERFQLAETGREGGLQGWLSLGAAQRLFAAGGRDLAELRRLAEGQDFRPVALGVQAQGQVRTVVRNLDQWNVAGVVRGSDPLLRDELVMFSAHWDHFGMGPGPHPAIFHGAVDNASGCGGVLAIAQALAAHPPKRSLMFFFPCGEEQGLLGSVAYVQAPLWPLAKTALVINLESLNFAGPTRDIGVMGLLNPALQGLCEEAGKRVALTLAPPKPDPAGLCFRADHYPFAKAGVQAVSPGFSLDGGWDFLGDKAATQARAAAFLGRYHQPTDAYDPAWDLRGMLQQIQFSLELGLLAGNRP